MNYIFELMISMMEQDKNPNTITFKKADIYSAYLELATEYVNEEDFEDYHEVEVNPYFRYHSIFQNLFLEKENLELKQTLMDILIHINFETDCLSGMNKRAFYQIFMEEACEKNCFGKNVTKRFQKLERDEKRKIADALVERYIVGNTKNLFIQQLCSFFPTVKIYFHQNQEILVYTAVKKNEERENKVILITKLFLPLQYGVQVYWKNHFGIIDLDETMILDEIELF